MIRPCKRCERIIARHYGEDFGYIIRSNAVTYANPPRADIAAGKLHLAWQRLAPGQDSAIRIGRVANDGLIVDWAWEDTHE